MTQDNIDNNELSNVESVQPLNQHGSPEVKEVSEDSLKEGEVLNCLKVKADAQDLPSEERKRKVKKLAGAISHSLRGRGEINVRCFGNAAIGKAAKALAIARKYIKAQSDKDKRLQLECSPAFITTKINNSSMTGICFVAFASEIVSEEASEVDLNKVKTVLKVISDPKDITDEDRKIKVKKLAGAIAHALEENKEVLIRCFGNATIGKAAKALAIARGYTATRGPDLYCWPEFIVAEMGVGEDKKERTGIVWYAYTNEI